MNGTRKAFRCPQTLRFEDIRSLYLRPQTTTRCRAALSSTAPPAPPQAGDVLQLSCTELAFGGEGVCKLPDGLVVFVPRALPGEVFTATVTKSKRTFLRATKLQTLRPHDQAAEPACRHFGPCGGCVLQSLRYDAQVEAKQRQVKDLLARVAGVADVEAVMRPLVPSAQQYHYRNKMEFSACGRLEGNGGDGGSTKRKISLGLHRPGSQHDVLPIESCSLQSPEANAILTLAQSLCRRHGLQAYSGGARSTGLLQHLLIRRGSLAGSISSAASAPGQAAGEPAEDEYLVNFVTSRDCRNELAPVAAALAQQSPARIAGIVNSVSQPGRPTAERRIAEEHVLHGRSHLVECLAGLSFEVSANSFFQVNTGQAERLYALVAEAAALRPDDVVLDLYCGAGTMTLMLALRCREAWGVEISESAVRDAENNARRNGITNARFMQGHVERLLAALPQAPAVVVVDPARSGLAEGVVAFLRQCSALRVVYVSCNPATQARDLKLLCSSSTDTGTGAAFRLVSVQAVDLYPQTPHVETVAVLER